MLVALPGLAFVYWQTSETSTRKPEMSKIKQYLPFVLVNAATATLTTLGTEAVKWGVEALKAKFGPTPPTKEEDKNGSP